MNNPSSLAYPKAKTDKIYITRSFYLDLNPTHQQSLFSKPDPENGMEKEVGTITKIKSKEENHYWETFGIRQFLNGLFPVFVLRRNFEGYLSSCTFLERLWYRKRERGKKKEKEWERVISYTHTYLQRESERVSRYTNTHIQVRETENWQNWQK